MIQSLDEKWKHRNILEDAVTWSDPWRMCKTSTSRQGELLNAGAHSWELTVYSSAQFSHSVVFDSLRPHDPQHTRPPCLTSTPRVHPDPCPPSHWCHPNISSCLPLFLLPSIFPSIRVLSNESALCIRWPKYWRFTFNISPSNEHPGLISFRMGWLDLLAVQGTLKNLLPTP